eukprot:COSAG02_NODE_2457_length_8810_cov_4.343933_5_plen_146_part_00
MPAMGPRNCSGNASSKPSWFLKLKHWCGKSYRQCNYHAGPCLVQVVAAHLSIDLDWATTPQASALRHEVCGRLRPCATRTTFIMTRACCAGGGSNSVNKISPRKITTHIMQTSSPLSSFNSSAPPVRPLPESQNAHRPIDSAAQQ